MAPRKTTTKAKTETASTKVPKGTRKAGKTKSTAAKGARALNALGNTSKANDIVKKATKKAAKKASKKTVKKTAKKTSTKAVKKVAKKKAVKKVAKKKAKKRTKKVTTQEIAEEIAQTSVCPEMAAAMMGAMSMNEEAAIEQARHKSEREEQLTDRLAVNMNRHDEMPNLELAADIVFGMDREAVKIFSGIIIRHDDIYARDAARVLYEVGEREPELLDVVVDDLVAVCEQADKDTLPFVMYALSPLADKVAVHLWDMRDVFWQCLAEMGEHSDLAHEAAVRLLAALCASGPDYARTLAGGLVDLLGKCTPKDVAVYAESVLPALGSAHAHRAKPVLDRRMKELTPAEVARLRRAVRQAQTGQYSYAA